MLCHHINFVLKMDFYLVKINATTFGYHLPKITDAFDVSEVMTLNINFDARPILLIFVTDVCVYGQSATQQKNYENGPVSKLAFEGIFENYFSKS